MDTTLVSIFSAINEFPFELLSSNNHKHQNVAHEKLSQLLSSIHNYMSERQRNNHDNDAWKFLVSMEIQKKLEKLACCIRLNDDIIDDSGFITKLDSGFLSEVLAPTEYDTLKKYFIEFKQLVANKLSEQAISDLNDWKDMVLTDIENELQSAFETYKKDHNITPENPGNEIEQRKLKNFTLTIKQIQNQQIYIAGLLKNSSEIVSEIVIQQINQTKSTLYHLRLGVKDYTTVLNKLNAKPNFFEYLFTKVREFLRIKTQAEKKVLNMQSKLVPNSQRLLQAWLLNTEDFDALYSNEFKRPSFAENKTLAELVSLLSSLVQRWFKNEISYQTMKTEGAKLVKRINKDELELDKADGSLGMQLYALLNDHKNERTFFIGIADHFVKNGSTQETLKVELGKLVNLYKEKQISYETLRHKGEFYNAIISRAPTKARSNKDLAAANNGAYSPEFQKARDKNVDDRLAVKDQNAYLLAEYFLKHVDGQVTKKEFDDCIKEKVDDGDEKTSAAIDQTDQKLEANTEYNESYSPHQH